MKHLNEWMGAFIVCICMAGCASEEWTTPEENTPPQTRAAATDYPQTGLSGMFGFAAVSNVTTGGTGGEVVYVYNEDQLSAQLSGSDRRIVVVAANISSNGKKQITLGANKSLIGSFAAHTLHNIYLRASSTTANMIFQNLTFSHDASINDNDDIQLYLHYGKGYWIDHCTFSGHSYNANGSDLDKLLYVGGEKADYITISQTKFMNHRYGLILGYPDDGKQANYDGYPRLSMFNNYFDNVYTRAPGLMRYGHYHVKNNYVNNFHLGFTIAQNARIYSEGNYFQGGNYNGNILDDKANGSFTDKGSYPTVSGQSSPQTSFNPAGSYSGYRVETPEYARQFAISWAGSQNSSSSWVFGY